jgi:hypothetical protein
VSDTPPTGRSETPALEVRVYRDGHLLERELCESEVEAALVVQSWQEIEGVECEVDDLSGGAGDADNLEPAPEFDADQYPTPEPGPG